MAIKKYPKGHYPVRWPTEAEFVRDVMLSPLVVGIAMLVLGSALGVGASAAASGAERPWLVVPLAAVALGMVGLMLRFCLVAYHAQEIVPLAERAGEVTRA